MINNNPPIIHTIVDTITSVTNSFKQNNKHLYITISNKKFTTSWDKNSASSIQEISKFILQCAKANGLEEKEKKSLLHGFNVITDHYRTKHNSLFSRILRIFIFSYRMNHSATLALIQKAQKELKLIPIVGVGKEKEKIEPKPPINPSLSTTKKKQTLLQGLNELEEQLSPILAQAKEASSDKDKIKLWKITEKIAEGYIQKGDIERATITRIKAAKALPPASLFSTLHLQEEDPKLGLVLQPIGPAIFKQHSVFVQTRKFTNGDQHVHVMGHLNHHMRFKLEKTIQEIEKNLEMFSAALPIDFCKKVTIINEKQISFYGRTSFYGKMVGPFSDDVIKNGFQAASLKNYVQSSSPRYPRTTLFDFEKIGKVKIYTYLGILALYNQIEIDLDASVTKEQAPEKLHLLFAALGLGTASFSPLEEDTDRLKMMQLFRIVYPRQAFDFEHDPATFEEPIDCLRARIVKKVPDMENQFKDHLSKMYKQQVYPHQHIFALKGLAMQVRKKGAMGLMAGMVGSLFTAGRRLASMLKMGVLSTLDRYEKGFIIAGDSLEQDLVSGGANSVFARLITLNMKREVYEYALKGSMQIFYDLTLIERGGYAYSKDLYGTKENYLYRTRPSILELTEQCQKSPYQSTSNEICIRNYIPPQFITGVLVQSELEKSELINILKDADLVIKNDALEDCINGIPIDNFIHVGSTFQMKFFEKFLKPGTKISSDGSVCQGVLNGQGKIYYSNEIDEGEFLNDQLDGEGMRIDYDHEIIQFGIFQKGHFVKGTQLVTQVF